VHVLTNRIDSINAIEPYFQNMHQLDKLFFLIAFTDAAPARSPPLAVQPSFGHFFSRVNNAWIRGYESVKGEEAPLSKVVVVSITGGARDYQVLHCYSPQFFNVLGPGAFGILNLFLWWPQVRSRMSSLDGIVPPTHGLTVDTAGMVNIWMSMEHQSILWCNQMVVQVLRIAFST